MKTELLIFVKNSNTELSEDIFCKHEVYILDSLVQYNIVQKSIRDNKSYYSISMSMEDIRRLLVFDDRKKLLVSKREIKYPKMIYNSFVYNYGMSGWIKSEPYVREYLFLYPIVIN